MLQGGEMSRLRNYISISFPCVAPAGGSYCKILLPHCWDEREPLVVSSLRRIHTQQQYYVDLNAALQDLNGTTLKSFNDLMTTVSRPVLVKNYQMGAVLHSKTSSSSHMLMLGIWCVSLCIQPNVLCVTLF